VKGNLWIGTVLREPLPDIALTNAHAPAAIRRPDHVDAFAISEVRMSEIHAGQATPHVTFAPVPV